MTNTPKRNIKQEKAISFFKQLDIMTMMEVIDQCKEIMDNAIEKKKETFNNEISVLNSMQEKIKA